MSIMPEGGWIDRLSKTLNSKSMAERGGMALKLSTLAPYLQKVIKGYWSLKLKAEQMGKEWLHGSSRNQHREKKENV